MPKLIQTIDHDPDLLIEEEGQVYSLHSGAIRLDHLWVLLNRLDGCCLDNMEERLRIMEEATKLSYHTGR